jgi:WD40 repeat protein
VKVNGVKIWDTKTKKLTAVLKGHRSWITAVAYSPDGNLLATASFDGTAVIWDASSGNQIRTLRGHQHGVKDVGFSPDGQRLFTAGGDGNLKVWDVVSGKQTLSTMAHKGGVWGAQFSPDGKLIATAGWSDVPDGEQKEVRHGTRIYITYSPSVNPLGEMKLWDASTVERKAFLGAEPSGIYSVAFSPDGTQLATAYSRGTVKLWDVAKLLEHPGTK